MSLVGDWLFDISKSRERAQELVISLKADVKSIEDTTNSTIEMINEYLSVKRGPVDSREKSINEFLSEVRQAFEDLERNAEEQYKQFSATVGTTVIDDLRHKVPEFDLDNMANWMWRFEKIPPVVACVLAMISVGAIARKVTRYLKETKWGSFSITGSVMGGIMGGELGGLLVFFTVEAISCTIENRVLKGYIEELTQSEQTMREIRKAIAKDARKLNWELMCIQLRSGNVGDGRGFYFRCVKPLIQSCMSPLLITWKASPVLRTHRFQQSGDKHTVHSPTPTLVALNQLVILSSHSHFSAARKDCALDGTIES